MPPSIKLHQLDTTILDAVRNIKGGPLPGVKGPIINGIVLNESALKGLKALTIAKQITVAIPSDTEVNLKAVAKLVGDRKWLVGFQIRSL